MVWKLPLGSGRPTGRSDDEALLAGPRGSSPEARATITNYMLARIPPGNQARLVEIPDLS